jgi:hypothetical protein
VINAKAKVNSANPKIRSSVNIRVKYGI